MSGDHESMADGPAQDPDDQDSAEENIAIRGVANDPMANLAEFFEDRRRIEEQKYEEFARSAEYASELRDAFALFSRSEDFAPGQLVQWKPGLRNRAMPTYGAPAVVIDYLDDLQVTDSEGHRLTEARDIHLGVLDGDGDFMTYTYNSARFTLWTD